MGGCFDLFADLAFDSKLPQEPLNTFMVDIGAFEFTIFQGFPQDCVFDFFPP